MRAVIAPHAGYSYSGPTAAFAYARIVPEGIRRVFVLGPSHHVALDGCAVTQATHLATPLGPLAVDTHTTQELLATHQFVALDLSEDEDEHSLEMHLPYLFEVLRGQEVTVVPIVVGSIGADKERAYGKLLAPYLADPATLFCISSDFCHWGRRFRYQPYDKAAGAIHDSIEAMDREGMRLIEERDPDGFRDYLRRTRNTICGRHPITVFMEALLAGGYAATIHFVHYAQSSACRSMEDSSVSYASAVVAWA